MQENEKQQYGISVNETDKENSSKELIQREAINGTPFVAVKADGHGWFLAFGKYRVSDEMPTLADAQEKAKGLKRGKKLEVDWTFILDVVTVMMAVTEEQKKGEN